ncbi:Sjogren's syndrome/scleroderma autoantigen 1 family protein [Natronomonas sp. EA1]|uniref:Sjogren's syndrome/scleroderma autoantigen 1 family protein n=1 Tax=Natronomonas sp. EA1 TaxID=3421655 RepID=UPI003EB76B4D
MSEFDKEAEREKLREKFERDKQKRQATERMSELLLKGATMTNHHCQRCGDPIFRQDGEEFCPTCGSGVAVEESGQASQPTDAQPAPDAQEPPAEAGEEPTAEPTPEPTPDRATESVDAPTAAEPTPVEEPAEPAPEPTPEPTPTTNRQPASPAVDADAEDDLAAARASLTRTLTRMAKRAEGAEDPRSATAYLEAAKEAAEALDALR